ncbi:hypothetical protein DRO03_10600, partial [Methanosarcinales archaeon]
MHKMKVIAGILIVIALAGLPVGVQAQGADDGLVAEWHFDEGSGSVLMDSSGNGNDGVIHGATWVEGRYGKALRFDGRGDFVEITPQSDVSAIGDFTISVWTYLKDWKTQTASNKDRQYVFDGQSHSKTVTSDFFRPGFGIVYDGNSYTEEIHNLILYDYNRALELNTQMSLRGKWIHNVFIRKGDMDYTYIGGQLISATYSSRFNVKSNELLNMQHNWFIGTFSGNNPNYNRGVFNYGFYGIIDEVCIYNRALTADEIKTLYEGKQTAFTLTKSVAPHSIKQGQTTTVTLAVKNTGTIELTDIEVSDTIPTDLFLVSGETSKGYESLRPKDSREFQYTLQPSDAGTFNLDPATATYADEGGNYHASESSTVAIEVIPSTGTTPAQVRQPPPADTTLTITKSPSLNSIRQFQETTITISIENSGTTDVTDIEITDAIHPSFDLTSGDFPNPKRYDLIRPGETRDLQYTITAKESGTFKLDSATVTYADEDGNIQEASSEPAPIKVISSPPDGGNSGGTSR